MADLTRADHLAGVLASVREPPDPTAPLVRLGVTVHHSDGPPMAPPEELDRWHAERGFACEVRVESYAPDLAPLWLHLRPGETRTLHAGYNAYITADGAIWRCRPEGVAGAHCKAGERNRTHLSVCLAGRLMTARPSGAQLDALRHVLVQWCARYGLGVDSVEGHRDAPGAATDCPGDNLYALLPTLRAEVAALLKGGA